MGDGFAPRKDANWPSADQRLLLRAALGRGEEALRAWGEWSARNDLRTLDDASFLVLPALLRNLLRLGVEGPEIPILRSTTRYAWCRNQLAARSVVEVVRLLEAAGIRPVLLKGAPLVLFYYRDYGARLMNDVDVLIREEDLPAAAARLEEAGWRRTEPLPPADFRPFLHAVPFTHERWLELDLHWRPLTTDCPAAAEERFRERARTRDVRGTAVRVPDATDLLLLTCVHGRKGDIHAPCRWVVDATTLVDDPEDPIDWDALLERAAEARLVAPVSDALEYLRHECGAAVPEEALRRTRAHPVTREDDRRYERILAGFLLAGRRLRWRAAFHWSHYAGVRSRQGRRAGVPGFLAHLLAFHGWYYGLRHRWQVPFVAAWRLLLRARRDASALRGSGSHGRRERG